MGKVMYKEAAAVLGSPAAPPLSQHRAQYNNSRLNTYRKFSGRQQLQPYNKYKPFNAIFRINSEI